MSAHQGKRRASRTRTTVDPAEDILTSLTDAFEALPAELRKAARYITSNPTEVAFRSMRSVARSAEVSPATMVRLAKSLGLDGYERLREAFQAQIEARPQSFTARAQKVRAAGVRGSRMDGIQRVIDEELASIQACVDDLGDADLKKVGRMLASAGRIYVTGLRGIYPAAFSFHYAATIFSDKTVLVDGSGGTYMDALRGIGPADVALVFTCSPYPREVLRGLRFAHERGAKLIAVTDSRLSPAARYASVVFTVKPTSAGLLSSAAANVLVARVLAAVFLSASGPESVALLRNTDEQLAAFEVYDPH